MPLVLASPKHGAGRTELDLILDWVLQSCRADGARKWRSGNSAERRKLGQNLDGGFLPKVSTPKRASRALRNSNCHGSFPVFILGWTIGVNDV
jgi:hypothetical protein